MTNTSAHADYCDKIHYSKEYLCSDEKEFRQKNVIFNPSKTTMKKEKIIKAWARRNSYKDISYAYGFEPFLENSYAEIVRTEKEAIKQWGKENIVPCEIKLK